MSFLSAIKTPINIIQNGQSYIDSLANKYIVKPLGVKGINGFVFDYEGETSLNLTADITDHYTEDNTAIHNHIALHPIKITLRGLVSEILVKPPEGIIGALKTIEDKLGTVEAYLQGYTPGMVQKIQQLSNTIHNKLNNFNNQVNRVNNVINYLGNIQTPWDIFANTNSLGQTRQQKAYEILEKMYLEKQIFSVETPYKFFDSMAIESLTFIQDENTKYISDIAITLKQVRFANIQFSKLDTSKFQNRLKSQMEDALNQGKTKGKTVDWATKESWLHSLAGN